MFTLVVNTGQLAGAITATCLLLFGVWRYVIRPARKTVKMANSVGENGKETVFQLLHGIKADVGTLKENIETITNWRTTVDLTLYQQNRELDALSVSMDALLERDDKR